MPRSPVLEQLSCTVPEAAAATRLSLNTWNRAMSWGQAKFTKAGGAVRVPIGDVNRVAREGFPNLPKGYKRKTNGNNKAGRPKQQVGSKR